jgi:hypothetical protein
MYCCDESEELKRHLAFLAERIRKLKANGGMSGEESSELRRDVLDTVLRLIEHKAAHGSKAKS